MNPVIRVSGLKQEIGRQKVLDGLSFELFSGECLGLFGPRGAGKTALLHILAGIDRFKAGSVEILGCDAGKSEAYKVQLGLVTQERSLFKDLKAYENLEYIAVLKNAGGEDIPGLISRFELQDVLGEPVSRLKAGVYQRLSLACAFLNSPQILIADDLINDLDPYSQNIILRELNSFTSGGGACVWGFSRIEWCAAVSRVCWLEDGLLSLYSSQEAQELWGNRLRLIEVQSGERDA